VSGLIRRGRSGRAGVRRGQWEQPRDGGSPAGGGGGRGSPAICALVRVASCRPMGKKRMGYFGKGHGDKPIQLSGGSIP
jgi:hypothetical protein